MVKKLNDLCNQMHKLGYKYVSLKRLPISNDEYI